MADACTRHAKPVAPENCFVLARIAECLREWTPKNLSGHLMERVGIRFGRHTAWAHAVQLRRTRCAHRLELHSEAVVWDPHPRFWHSPNLKLQPESLSVSKGPSTCVVGHVTHCRARARIGIGRVYVGLWRPVGWRGLKIGRRTHDRSRVKMLAIMHQPWPWRCRQHGQKISGCG
jgi:hypothetical protein